MHLRDPPTTSSLLLQKTLGMTPGSLLSALLLLGCACTVWGAVVCNNRCCNFVEGFPARLKMLRESYSQIRDYYVSKGGTVAAASVEHLVRPRPGDAACVHLLTARSLFAGGKR